MGRGFSSTGQASGMSRIERFLQNQKGSQVTMGVGAPLERDGGIGDITVRTVSDGIRCYIKTGSGWVDVNTMVPATELVWHNMILQNSWVRHSTTDSYAPSYAKDANGFVHFRGAIKNGTGITAVITELPAGFLPNITVHMPAATVTSIASIRVQGMDATAADQGKVNCSHNGNTSRTSLDGVSYYAGEIIVGTSTSGGAGGGSKGTSGGSGGGGGGA